MDGKKYTVESVSGPIRGFLEPVLRHARIRVAIEIVSPENPNPDFENPDILVKFSGADVDLLLENKAETLLALEHLTLEVLHVPAERHSMVCFDANDYRLMRIEELRLSALTAAERVKKSNSPFQFNPMNSRERRIIHLALRNDAAVRSESAGAGPFRQVVIYPAGMPSLPTAGMPAPAPMIRRGGGRRR